MVENIIRAAEERKKAMLNQNELVRAQAKAKEIVDDAKRSQQKSERLQMSMLTVSSDRTEESISAA